MNRAKAALTSACVVLSDETPAADLGTAPTSALHEVEAIIMSVQNQPANFRSWWITYASRRDSEDAMKICLAAAGVSIVQATAALGERQLRGCSVRAVTVRSWPHVGKHR